MKYMFFYSGGKDSLATLLLSRAQWLDGDFEVVFVDTGNHFPETYAHMEKVKRLVKNFTVLHSNCQKWQGENGNPVDVVPTSYDKTGRFIYGAGGVQVPYVSRWDCCRANIWTPMAEYITLTRPDFVIRGDRGEERELAPKEAEGIRMLFPIFDWSCEKVQEFIAKEAPRFGLLEKRHMLPEGSSLDCMTCTAYNVEHKCRMAYLKEHHPAIYEANTLFFEQYKCAVFNDLKELM